MKNFLQHLHETTTLGNVNPTTGKPESGVHEYDAQGNKVRTYTGSSAPSNTTAKPDPNLPKPAPGASSTSRYTNPEAERQNAQEFEDRFAKRNPGMYTPKTVDTPPSATREDRMAARFPEAYPEKEVSPQLRWKPAPDNTQPPDELGLPQGEGEYETVGHEVKDVNPVVTSPNDPKYNEILDQPSAEEYGEDLRKWAEGLVDTQKKYGVDFLPPDPVEPKDDIPAATKERLDNIEDSDQYQAEWDRIIGLGDERSRSQTQSMFESSGLLSFRGFLAEAGIRRKMRVAQATDTAAHAASLDPMASPAEKRAAINTAWFTRLDVKREQNKRTGRVLRRAKAEAEAHVPAPTTGGIHAHVERLGRVGEMAAGFAGQMADVEKPGFIRARERRSLSPRGNDGY